MERRNTINAHTNFPLNNSLIINIDKLINLLTKEINKRGNFTNLDVEYSFNNLSYKAYSEIIRIDYLFQHGFINYSKSIMLIADVLENEQSRLEYENFLPEDLRKNIVKLYAKMNEIYKYLIYRLSSGIVSYEQFLKEMNSFHSKENEIMSNLIDNPKEDTLKL